MGTDKAADDVPGFGCSWSKCRRHIPCWLWPNEWYQCIRGNYGGRVRPYASVGDYRWERNGHDYGTYQGIFHPGMHP